MKEILLNHQESGEGRGLFVGAEENDRYVRQQTKNFHFLRLQKQKLLCGGQRGHEQVLLRLISDIFWQWK